MKTLRAGFLNLISLAPWIAVLLVIALMLTGCAGMTPGNVRAVAPVSDAPRAGNVYLLRGFIGIFSTGMDDLGQQLNREGVNAMVFQDDQWPTLASTLRKKYASVQHSEPIVLIGHSYGADDVVRIARELNRDNISVDLLVTLDPVTPPVVPPNVKRCVNLYQSNGAWDTLPWLRGVPLEADTRGQTVLANYNIRTDRTDLYEPGLDHFNIEKKRKVRDEVLRHIADTCPPRAQWAMRNPNATPEFNRGAVAQQAAYRQSAAQRTAPPNSAQPTTRPSVASSTPRVVSPRSVASGNGN